MWNVSGWKISSVGLNGDESISNGNRFLIGNGFLGYRGTLEEAAKEEMPSTIVSGLFDRNGDKWREPVNVPNGLAVRVSRGEILSHEQSLDFRYGIHRRHTTWRDASGAAVTVDAERFASMDDVHLLCLKYSVWADRDTTVKLERGIDCDVYDINGPHLGAFAASVSGSLVVDGSRVANGSRITDDSLIAVDCRTLELGIPLSVVSACSIVDDVTDGHAGDSSFAPRGSASVVRARGASTMRSSAPFFASESLTLNLRKEETLTLYVFSSVHTGAGNCSASENASSSSPAATVSVVARKSAIAALEAGWDALLERHRAKWDAIWKTGDVEIEGDDYAQCALRYSLYHLQIIAPRHADSLSIPARGLSGQTYKGAIFWDTEMFISPYFLHTDPEVAKRFILYRISTLAGAKRKASEYGFEGAFYAWESQESGDDACSDFNVVDVFTRRPVRTYFRDKQIHISADVVHALATYVDATGDDSILREGGFEMALECAKFFMSWIVWSPVRNRYEVPDVIGPDEYHERVANNAFTNRMIAHTFETVLSCIARFCESDPDFLRSALESAGFSARLELLEDMNAKLYMPAPGEDLVIEQFDGYFRHEDCSLAEVRSRLVDPKEYWGGGTGVATATRIIKQADVVLMLTLFGKDYPSEVIRANLDFYGPRTEHGSSLSACVYSLLACETGDSAWGYPFFVKTAEIDMTGESKQFAGLVYIGGTHPAANGGAWISAIRGFCGFRVEEGSISVVPRLPPAWDRVRFHAAVGGKDYLVTVTKDDYSICEQ